MQDSARVDGESRVGGSASFDQVGDVGLDVFEGLPGQRSPFDGEHAAVRDGGLSGAAADQGRVQVAWSGKGRIPAGDEGSGEAGLHVIGATGVEPVALDARREAIEGAGQADGV
jgi:hypothetical protein